MKILIDENIPYAEAFFADIGTVVRFSGRSLQASDLVDADVLLVRSITKVNASLLSQANSLKFVGTATIGEDHIDKAELSNRGIAFSSAPGCNANSVAEFVINALFVLAEKYQIDVSNKKVAIIGLGNIGQNLHHKLTVLGIETLLCDPFKSSTPEKTYVDFEYAIANADIITFHTPLTSTGTHPTHHLLNANNLTLLKDNVCLINASRGEVIDNTALLEHITQRSLSGKPNIKLVLDVWEGEPNPLQALIPHCDLTSAHIAGYSLEGKATGTEMLYKNVCQLLNVAATAQLKDFLPEAAISSITLNKDSNVNKDETVNNEVSKTFTIAPNNPLKTLIHTVYDVRRDDSLFRNLLNEHSFDWLRKNYPIRREWSSISVNCQQPELAEQLSSLGFHIK